MAHSSEDLLNDQTGEEIIEIDENGVVHAKGRTPSQLKSTVLRDPEGEYSVATELEADRNLLLTVAEAQSDNRWYHEQQKLRAFPAFHLLRRDGVIVAAEGAIDTQNDNTYGIRIDLTGFPYALPKIFPKDGWTVHPAVKHKYADGSLCIMRAAQWRTPFTVAFVVAKTAIWLAKYEMWKRNGNVWPGREQKH